MIFKPVLGHFVKDDGTAQIKIYIYSGGKKEYVPTNFYVRPDQFEKGRVKKSRPNADYINSELSLKIAELERTWLKKKDLSPKDIRKGKNKSLSFYAFTEQFIRGIKDGTILIEGKNAVNKGQSYSGHSCKAFTTHSAYYKEFAPDLNWGDVTKEWLNDFIVFMREKNYADNTIAKSIKVLRTLMERGKKHHSNSEYESFEASYIDSDAIFLTEQEVEAMVTAKVDKHLREEQDRFFLSYNFFLRFGDSIKVDPKDIFEKNGKHFAKLMDNKTKNREYIPLFNRSLKILKRHKFQMPKTTNQESNWKLKEIGKLAGISSIYTRITVKNGAVFKDSKEKYKFITTHTARRSMATNYYLSMKKHGNVDLKSLQLMGGWKSIAMLEKYLKIDALENALDAANHPFFNRGSGTPIPL